MGMLSKPVMIASSAYYPVRSGTSFFMQALLEPIAREDLVVTANYPDLRVDKQNVASDHRVHYVMRTLRQSSRLNRRFLNLQIRTAAWQIARLAKRYGCGAIVAVQPSLQMTGAATLASRISGLPLIPYIHDTIAEHNEHTINRALAQRVQKQMFAQMHHMIVISKSLQELYKNKYGIDSDIALHPFSGEIPEQPTPPPPSPSASWSGGIYTVNAEGLRRIAAVLDQIGEVDFNFTTGVSERNRKRLGLDKPCIKSQFLPSREDYLNHLARQSFHVLSLNWPDESSTHLDELNTIFPTKTLDYFASGRPVLVHCPEDYFLARFFRDYDCGYVVSERDPAELEAVIQKLITADSEDTRRKVSNGLRLLQQYRADVVADSFLRSVQRAIS